MEFAPQSPDDPQSGPTGLEGPLLVENVPEANPTAQPQDIVVPDIQMVIAPGGGQVDLAVMPLPVDGVDHVQIAIPMSPIDLIRLRRRSSCEGVG